MMHRFAVFRQQYPVVLRFIQHLAYHRGRTDVSIDPTDRGQFWVATATGHLQLASIAWCIVFGSQKEVPVNDFLQNNRQSSLKHCTEQFENQ